jgi:hypothetical protein
VIERVVAAIGLRPGSSDAAEEAFLQSLSLTQQPRTDLYALYCGWLSRIEAINAARLTGAFSATDDAGAIDRRRAALDAHVRLTKEIESLRSRAKREKQLSRRVNLNMEVQRREAELSGYKKNL